MNIHVHIYIYIYICVCVSHRCLGITMHQPVYLESEWNSKRSPLSILDKVSSTKKLCAYFQPNHSEWEDSFWTNKTQDLPDNEGVVHLICTFQGRWKKKHKLHRPKRRRFTWTRGQGDQPQDTKRQGWTGLWNYLYNCITLYNWLVGDNTHDLPNGSIIKCYYITVSNRSTNVSPFEYKEVLVFGDVYAGNECDFHLTSWLWNSVDACWCYTGSWWWWSGDREMFVHVFSPHDVFCYVCNICGLLGYLRQATSCMVDLN